MMRAALVCSASSVRHRKYRLHSASQTTQPQIRDHACNIQRRRGMLRTLLTQPTQQLREDGDCPSLLCLLRRKYESAMSLLWVGSVHEYMRCMLIVDRNRLASSA